MWLLWQHQQHGMIVDQTKIQQAKKVKESTVDVKQVPNMVALKNRLEEWKCQTLGKREHKLVQAH